MQRQPDRVNVVIGSVFPVHRPRISAVPLRFRHFDQLLLWSDQKCAAVQILVAKLATGCKFSKRIPQCVSWSSCQPALTMRAMTTDLKQMVGRRVREARKRLGWTQEDLAERIERAVETVSNLERGHTVPTLDTLERVGRALGVPVRDFFEEADAGSSRHAELRVVLGSMLSQLSTEDLETAVELVQVLLNRAGKKGEKPSQPPSGWQI